MLTPLNITLNQPTFEANLKSPKLKFDRSDFFIKIKGYGKNEAWADEVIEVADSASRMIQKNASAERTLRAITLGVSEANRKTDDPSKRLKSGILRTMRLDWFGGDDKDVYTPYENSHYKVYKDRLDAVAAKPLKKINDDIGMSRPYKLVDIKHGNPEKINSSLDYVFSMFKRQFLNLLMEN